VTAAPREYVQIAQDWLLARTDKDLDALFPPDQPLTVAHAEALAQEFDAAINDRGREWVATLIAGRPYATPLVEWEQRERLCPLCGDVSSDGSVHLSCAHKEQARADMMPVEDAPEAAANQEHRW
jgi:hypothetical protein